jgi:hypothetical protein
MDFTREFHRAVADWQDAIDQFRAADEISLDYTIYQLQAAEERVAMILRQARGTAPSHKGSAATPAEVNDPRATPPPRLPDSSA